MAKSTSIHSFSRRASSASVGPPIVLSKIPHYRVITPNPLEENYTLGDKLGEGSFGTVFKVIDSRTNETLACKQIYKDKVYIMVVYHE